MILRVENVNLRGIALTQRRDVVVKAAMKLLTLLRSMSRRTYGGSGI